MIMSNKNYGVIPVLISVILIPQLLFWWLVPSSTEARFAIYFCGTFIMFAAVVTLFITYWNSGLRRAVSLAIVVGTLQLLTVGCATFLVVKNLSVRSSLYTMAIIALVHVIVLVPMVISAIKPERMPIINTSIAGEQRQNSVNEFNNEPNYYNHRMNSSEHEDNSRNVIGGPCALPPRNR